LGIIIAHLRRCAIFCFYIFQFFVSGLAFPSANLSPRTAYDFYNSSEGTQRIVAAHLLTSLISLIVLVAVSLLAVQALHQVFDRGGASNRPARWRVFAQDLGGNRYAQLALVSGLSLFVEMLMIRWVSSEIRIFAYFKNFVLVACFLGFGLGCCRCRRAIQLMATIAPLLLLTLILKAPGSPLRNVLESLPQMLGGGTEVNMWGVPTLPTNWNSLLAIGVMVGLFVIIAAVFIPFGQLVGWYLENATNGVAAYSVNVLASLLGVAVYTLLCFLYQPPWVWFLVAAVVTLVFFRRNRKASLSLGVTFLVCTMLVALPANPGEKIYWSPYQKLTLTPAKINGETVAYRLQTNGSWYQQIVDLSPEFVRAHPREFNRFPVGWNSYNLPYHFYSSPPSVLVLGAGMGNDVAAALRNGAGRVVAVEIDPLILKLGREFHFEHPYQSPRTQAVVDDARSYVENSREKFDLIVFSLLDSHTTASHFSNIRIDNYVYTREALRKARELLKPGGLFVVKFQVDTPWISGRLFELMQDAFGQAPVQFQGSVGNFDTSGRFFIAGSPERIAAALRDPELAAYVKTHSQMPMQPATLTTDDWPYFYQHEPGLPLNVILVSIAVLAVFGWLLRETRMEAGTLEVHFMLLGAGFMLLETQIVSKMALLFGTTWVVNSLVVAGILCLIVAANIFYGGFPRVRLPLAYACLFISLLVMFAVPRQKLLLGSVLLRVLAATAVLCAPVFFAGIIFVSSFAKANFRGSALGANLFGALLGGLLESLSLWSGLRSLTIVAAVLYIGSAIFLRRRPLPAAN
jgi:SAM-dependent methyltransferase